MVNAVECTCGHVFVTTKEEKAQCKCGRRLHVRLQSYSIPSQAKNRQIAELNTIISQQKTIIEKFIQNFDTNKLETEKIIKEYRDLN